MRTRHFKQPQTAYIPTGKEVLVVEIMIVAVAVLAIVLNQAG